MNSIRGRLVTDVCDLIVNWSCFFGDCFKNHARLLYWRWNIIENNL